ncbi:MAG: hypothetical protein ACOCRX_07400 [Candidatus Woesearchaeota archaeon]
MTKLTKLERKVIITYMNDDYVSDYGWDNEHAGAWIDVLSENCGLKGRLFSGVMSSLYKKELIIGNDECFSLTKKGIEVARTLV